MNESTRARNVVAYARTATFDPDRMAEQRAAGSEQGIDLNQPVIKVK